MLCKKFYLKIDGFSKANDLDRQSMKTREKDTNICRIFTIIENAEIKAAQDTVKLLNYERTT
jgi:hypothetical protein